MSTTTTTVVKPTEILKDKKLLKEVNRDVKLEALASGYTPAKRRMEIITLIFFFSFWFGTGYNIFSQFDIAANHLILSSIGWLIAMFIGDFIGGFVHWACDTWGTPESKPFGLFIRSFREHHIHPKAMCAHDFVEVSADSCLLTIPFLMAGTFWRVQNAYQIEVLILHIAFWTCLFVLFTNQVHKWAHLDRKDRPYVILGLQKIRFILCPEVHRVHHRPPFDQNYCIFNGWMNPILASFNFWRKVEDLITKYTGFVPRADDADWTGRFDVNPTTSSTPGNPTKSD